MQNVATSVTNNYNPKTKQSIITKITKKACSITHQEPADNYINTEEYKFDKEVIDMQIERIGTLEAMLKIKEEIIETLKEENKEIVDLEKQNSAKEETITKMKNDLDKMTKIIVDNNYEIIELNNMILALENDKRNLQEENKNMLSKNANLQGLVDLQDEINKLL